MTILNQTKKNSKPKFDFNHNGGNLSTDCGLLLVSEFLKKIGFDNALEQCRFNDNRSFSTYSNTFLTKQLIYQIIAGYSADDVADELAKDSFCSLLENQKFASQPSLSRFWKRFDETTVADFNHLIMKLFEQTAKYMKLDTLIFDLDSTHSDTYGNQEGTAYNGHYKTTGYHPLLMTEATTGSLVSTQLRSGNLYTSNGVVDFVEPILERFSNSHVCYVRGDSGFAVPELFDLLEEQGSYYTIRLKNNAVLTRIADAYCDEQRTGDIGAEEYTYFIEYKAKSWSTSREVAVRSWKEEGTMIFHHEFIVTNLQKPKPMTIIKMYRKRGNMENIIKELKNGFYYDKSDSSGFVENQARAMLAGAAHNIIQLMKHMCFDGVSKSMTIDSIRLKLFKVAGKTIKHSRKIRISLSNSHVYRHLFNLIATNIQQCRLIW